jgi:hypothetical protein
MGRASLVLRGILREPTVHFVLLAGALFALMPTCNPGIGATS